MLFTHTECNLPRHAGTPTCPLMPFQDLLLHGEHYLRLDATLPRAGPLHNTARIVDAQDKVGFEWCAGFAPCKQAESDHY